MAGKYGIIEIIRVSNLLIEIGNIGEGMSSKSGIFDKAKMLMSLSDEIISIVKIDFKDLKKELGELDDQDKELLLKSMKEKLDLKDDALEAKIEMGMELLIKSGDLISDMIEYVKGLKKSEPKEEDKSE